MTIIKYIRMTMTPDTIALYRLRHPKFKTTHMKLYRDSKTHDLKWRQMQATWGIGAYCREVWLKL